MVRCGVALLKGAEHPAQGSVRLERSGPVGDRTLCLVDPDRRAVLRTAANPTLLLVRARRFGDRLEITGPGGLHATGIPRPTGEPFTVDYWGRREQAEPVDGPWSAALSAWLGRSVLLARVARPGGVVYAGAVSLVTTGALDELARRAGVGEVDPRRLRPTLVVRAPARAEPAWAGAHLAVGEVVIRVRGELPRCAVIDIDPRTGTPGSRLLRTLGEYRPSPAGPLLGLDADVVQPGTVRPGDRVVARAGVGNPPPVLGAGRGSRPAPAGIVGG